MILKELPELAFDHDKIIEDYLTKNPFHLITENDLEYTTDEVREKVLDHIRKMSSYWCRLDNKSVEERLDGLAFSILTMLDGCTDLPGFIVAPDPHEEDKSSNIEKKQKYFPENHDLNIRCSISGYLHELYYKNK